MHRYQQLMVLMAGTEGDEGLIRYAAMVARMGTAKTVRFVHVLSNTTGSAAGRHHDVVLAELQEKVRTHLTDVPKTVEVLYDVLAGPLVDRLLVHTAEHHTDLLLVGDQCEVSDRKVLSRRLAMKAPCSVWMVPDGGPASIKRILVPIDFSEHAADSIRVATSMARLCGHVECLAVHIYFNEAVVTYEGYDRVLRGQEEQAYKQFISPINCQGVKVTPLFEEGVNVAHAIGRLAKQHDVDLIVMATRGRSRSSSILLGSVTEEMLIETKVSLLAVKHFGARLGVVQALLDRRFRSSGDLHTA